MNKPRANMAASVHQHLKNHAKSGGHEFNDLLHHFALERFIYRLSQSQYADQFVLKGALLLRVWRLSASTYSAPTRWDAACGPGSRTVRAPR